MSNEEWNLIICQSQNGSDSAFNKAVAKLFINEFRQKLLRMTKDPERSREIYTLSITKFWERFVLRCEPLPKKNIKGYIYLMCKNAYLDELRKESSLLKNRNSIQDAQELVDTYSKSMYENKLINEIIDAKDDKQLLLRKLYESINNLEQVCQDIIFRNIYNKEKLKDIKEELGFMGGYQSIVDKKKRCIKKLTKVFFSSLKQIEDISQIRNYES